MLNIAVYLCKDNSVDLMLHKQRQNCQPATAQKYNPIDKRTNN
ncbi:hypothetical protein V3C97_07150 [Ligilactobacillus saerimneri]